MREEKSRQDAASGGQQIYVTGAETGSGKSIVALAMMETLTGQGVAAGFFRPMVRDTVRHDPLIEMIRQRYALDVPYEALYGCTAAEARELIRANRYRELLKRILEKFRALQSRFERLVCAGTGYSGGYAAMELDFNCDVANNLGCILLPVVRGRGRSNQEIADAVTGFHKALEEHGSDWLATVVNRVAPEQLESLKQEFEAAGGAAAVYLVPADPRLGMPTLGDIARELDYPLVYGESSSLNRTVDNYKVAAMHVPDFLDYVRAGSLVITPGDRADILLACFGSYPSSAYPQIAGVLLTGHQQPAPQVMKLLRGLGRPPFAVLGAPGDTFTVAMKVNRVKARLQPGDEHKIATALGLVETHVDLAALARARPGRRRVTPLMFEYDLVHRARSHPRHIVLPEGNEERILRAAELLRLREVVRITLLGNEEYYRFRKGQVEFFLEQVAIVDPLRSEWRREYALRYHELRRHKGISEQMAWDTLADVSYFGTMMVYMGQADGMVSGAVHTTQHTIRPAFEIIRTRPGIRIVSSVFFMCLEDRVLVYGDCAVNPDPDARQLADIAVSSADTARLFGVEPRVAMLSYSTGASGKGAAVDKVREATQLARELRPDVMIEGPIQYDAAIDAGVASTRLPGSPVAGNATVFIFPDLNTGNNTYKAVQRSADAIAIGPVLQGLNKPVNDLSRGCTVTDIVNTVVITAVQAQAGDNP